METLLLVLSVVVLMFVLLEIYSFRSTRSMFREQWGKGKLDEKFIIENIIYQRSALRGIYGGLVIIASLLTVLGIRALENIEKTVSESVSQQIQSSYKVDLQELGKKQLEIARMHEAMKNDYQLSSRYLQSIREGSKKLTFFVIRDIRLSEQELTGKTIAFGDLTTYDGLKLPRFKTPPSVMLNPKSAGITVLNLTADSIKVGAAETWGNDYSFDLWIYNRAEI